MKLLAQRIREAYTRNPQASGEEILKQVGAPATTTSRETLVQVQSDLRGKRPSHRFTLGGQHYGVSYGRTIGTGMLSLLEDEV